MVFPDPPEDLTSLLEMRPPVSVDRLLMDLVNAPSAGSEPVVLVLDDYHLIEDHDIHYNVALFLGNLPPAEWTEEWVAGLQLAALSTQDKDDIVGILNEFCGSHRYIVDYLLEEVWQYQSSKIQTFLLQTAVLDELCTHLTNE